MVARDPNRSLQALAPTNEPLLLFIRATDGMDHDTPDPEQEIRIFLRDINDNAPQFQNLPRIVTFREVTYMYLCSFFYMTSHDSENLCFLQNTNEGTTIFNVEVTDRDTGANAQLQYRIQSIDGVPCTDDCVGL